MLAESDTVWVPTLVTVRNLLGDGRYDDETCLLYTSDAADERSSVDLGGRRIIKKKMHSFLHGLAIITHRAVQLLRPL